MSDKNQDELGRRLVAAIRASESSSDQVGQNVGQLLGLNRTDGHCLEIIEREGGEMGVTAGTLATALGLSTGAVTTVIDRLEGAGYVHRVPDPDDRRRVRIRATALTCELVDLLFARMPALGRAMAGDLHPEEAERIIGFLKANAEVNRQVTLLLRKQVEKAPQTPRARLEAARAMAEEIESLIARFEAAKPRAETSGR